jgi:transcriptional regulator with XRE-family HTH domain
MASKRRKPSVGDRAVPKCGRRIIALRTFLKINQAELGKRVGASAMSISRWEGDSLQPPPNYLIILGLLATPDAFRIANFRPNGHREILQRR